MPIDKDGNCYAVVRTQLMGKRVDYSGKHKEPTTSNNDTQTKDNRYTVEAIKQRIAKRRNKLNYSGPAQIATVSSYIPDADNPLLLEEPKIILNPNY